MTNAELLIAQYGLTNSLSQSTKDDLNRILGSAVSESIEIVLERLSRERQKAGLDPVPPDVAAEYRRQAEELRLMELEAARKKREQTILIIVGIAVVVIVGVVLVVLQKRKKDGSK